MNFGKVIDIFTKNQSIWIYGIQMTLLLAFVGTLIGLVIGLLLGCIRAIKVEPRDSVILKIFKKCGHYFVNIYVWLFRGTPMMVQAVFFYYLLKPILDWDVVTAGITIVSINTGAYMAEIIRSGIQAVDNGQIEGARSIGMTSPQTMFSIVLPQAIKNSFPAIGNEFIVNIKDSSMLNVIGLVELFFQTRSVAGSNMLFAETYFITAVIYLILTSVTTLLLGWVERRMNLPKTPGPSSSTIPNMNREVSGNE